MQGRAGPRVAFRHMCKQPRFTLFRRESVFTPAMALLSSAVGGELYLDSWVTAHLLDGSSHRGVLHTVDPETGTVILLKPEGVSACEPHCDAHMLPC